VVGREGGVRGILGRIGGFGILDTRQNKFSWLWGIYIPQDGILLFSGRSSGTAINRCTRYGNPQGCPSDTHKIKISIVHLEDLRGSVVRAIAFTLAKSI